MALKKPSQAAAGGAKAKPNAAAVEALADQLADRPYGESLPAPKPTVLERPKAKPISISLPPDVIDALEDQVIKNKRSGEGPRTVSGLIKLALRQHGYKV